jgi:nucleotide-binding universal stress UspA family protein
MRTRATTAPEDFVIAHATDLHPDGGVAMAHGVALARSAHSPLVSYHAASADVARARPMPEAAELLRRWGLDEGDVAHTRVQHSCCEDPVDTLLDAIGDTRPGLMVVGTHRTTGLARALHSSVAESLARNIDAPTLFVPIGQRGFVDEATGALGLRRVLIPAGSQEHAERALDVLAPLLERVGCDAVELVVLVASSRPTQDPPLPGLSFTTPRPGWSLTQVARQGPVGRMICEVAEELDVDLVAMATHGHDSLWDVLRGSHTEQVVHAAGCPVLSIPMS